MKKEGRALLTIMGIFLIGGCSPAPEATGCILHPYISRSGFSRSDYEMETAKQALELYDGLCKNRQADIYIVDGSGGINFKEKNRVVVFLPSTVETQRVITKMGNTNVPKEDEVYTLIAASYLFHEGEHAKGIRDEKEAWRKQIGFLEKRGLGNHLVNDFLRFARTKITDF